MNEAQDREAAERRVADWLSKGWKIGVFENMDLGARMVGHRIALPFGDEFDAAEIGKAKAPDSPSYGMGWRYILIAKPLTAEDAADLIFREGA